MLIKDLKALFHKELDDIYGPDEVFTFFFMLTEHYCNISRLDVALNTNLSVTTEEKIQIFKALESFLVRGGDRDELYNEVDRFNAQKKSNQ